MTISTTASSVILQGNGATTSFVFNFNNANSSSDISVIYTDANGNETTLLPSQYNLSLNAPSVGQIWGNGGTVTYPTSGPPISSGTSLTITRTVPLTQTSSISNQGDFAPAVIEQALDTLCLEIQQVSARTGQFRGTWATNIQYNFGDIVVDGVNGANTTNWYLCSQSNLSGVWSTDLSNSDWTLILNLQSIANPGTVIAGGDLTGNYPNPTIAKVQGHALTVTGITGSGNLVQSVSPTLTGSPLAPTPSQGDNSTKIATTEFTDALIMNASIFGWLPSAISGTNTTAAVTITAGRGVDSTVATVLSGGPYSWSVSNGNAINGYAGGTTLPNSTTINFFFCQGASGSGTFASTSLTPTFPAGYTTYSRRIFSLITNSSGAFLTGTPVEIEGGGMRFEFGGNPPLDINATNPGTSQVVAAISVPSGIVYEATLNVGMNTGSGTGAVIFQSLNQNNQPAANSASPLANFNQGSTGQINLQGQVRILTNASSQIAYRANYSNSTSAVYAVTLAWVDFRRS